MLTKIALLMRLLIATLIVCLITPLGVLAKTPPDMLVIARHIDGLSSLDPQESFELTGSDVLNNVYDRLVSFDPKNLSAGYQPSLAESWAISEDGKTFTFKMRADVKFQSGNPVTAQDAEYSLRRAVLLEKSPSFILKQFGFNADNIIETIKATDERTLVLKLDKKYAPSFVLNCLTATIAGIVDSALVKKHEQDNDWGNNWLKTNTAGSGPYRVARWKPNELLMLDRNDDYFKGAAHMKRVVIRHIGESATQRLLLERGNIDIARKLSPEDITAVSEKGGIKVEDDLRGRIMYMALNQKHPILSKPEVREALRWLVDYQGITASFLKGQYTVHQSYIPQTYLGEMNDKPFQLNVEKAKALLKEAGHAEGFEIRLSTGNSQESSQVAQSIQNTFAQAGIKLEINTGTSKQILGVYRAREHDIFLGSWSPDYPDPQTNASTFAANGDNSDAATTGKTLAWRNAWDIPEMTLQTKAAVEELDREKRAALYQEAQRRHQKNSPFVILFQQIEQNALQQNINHFYPGSAVTSASYRFVTK